MEIIGMLLRMSDINAKPSQTHSRWLKLWLMYFLKLVGCEVIEPVGVVKVLLMPLNISFFST